MTLANFDLTTPAGEAVRAKYRREGATAERERIIKLLELWQSDDDESGITYKELIALIKGENK